MRVGELWRYPVKSLRGQRCESIRVDPRGFEGDRAFALVDGDGKFGSHKNTRRFVRMDGLFELAGLREGPDTRVLFPDGRRLSPGLELDGALSEHVGRPVTLRAEGEVSHQDAGALHIVTTASLRWLAGEAASARKGAADVRRFRPNIVLEAEGEELLEHTWLGKVLRIGEVQLRIRESTERCVMTTLAQEELPKDPSVLRAIAQKAGTFFGVYAEVLRTGVVRAGDEAFLLDAPS